MFEAFLAKGCGLVIALALLMATSMPAMAAGQAAHMKHPVLKHNLKPDKAVVYEKAVERVMAMSEEQMLSFVPDRPCVRFCYCPNCHGGSQGSSIYQWTIDKPEQLKCRYCRMVFPNDKYPCDRVIKGANALGEEFTYHYHQDNARSDLRIFIPGHVLMHKRGWIMRQAHSLAAAYHVTRKEDYARRAALILDRVAQVYPRYPVMKQWITTFDFQRQKPPYSAAGGKWGRWAWSELPSGVPAIYDLVYDSVEFDKLSKVRGYDVREKFETDFLKATWEYTNTFKRHDNNMAPFYLVVAAQIGKVINEPDYVHWAHRWLLEILMAGCFYDGMWHEAPSYHYQVMGGLRAGFAELKGYTDPPGYVNSKTGNRFDALDPDKDIAFFAKARNAPAVVGFPNGSVSPIHDTWANGHRHKPRTQTVSTILPGYGHASLGCGSAAKQMQAQLHFSGCYGHSHYDSLNLTLFAEGREMLCDIGYTHTKLRALSVSTVGHNLVAVDRTQQTAKDANGDLLAYFPNVNGISVVEVDGRSAYANIKGLDTYRRLLVLIPASGEDAYVVDVFRVRGGATHDWLLHGSANHNMTATCDVALAGKRENLLEGGEQWDEPKTEGSRFNCYGVIRDVATGVTDGGLVTTFAYEDRPDNGLRVHLLAGGKTEVLLGRSPSIRRAGSDSNKVWDFWMPQLVVRRTGARPLASTFVAVHEPFAGKPFIDRVDAVPLTPADAGVVAVRVKHGDTVDTIVTASDLSSTRERTTASCVSVAGWLGIVREVAGKTTGLWLFGGRRLASKTAQVTASAASYRGRVTAAARKADGADEDAFVVDAELAAGDALHGTWMIVTHPNGCTHGYEIDHVETREGKTWVVLTTDHGLRIDGKATVEVYFPQRKMKGANSFVIPLAVTANQRAD